MSRIRTIKPEWLDDEHLALASLEARVMSVALMLLADDLGNGRANVTMLAGRVFPGLANPREDSTRALEELRSIGFVTLYEVDGQHYFSIRNWLKHQRIDRPSPGKVPPPPVGAALTEPGFPGNSEDSTNPREPSTNPRDRSGDARASRARAGRASPPTPTPIPDPDPEGVQGEGSEVGTPEPRDTPCPLNLLETFPAFGELATHYRVSEAGIREAAKEFHDYWTVGAGCGKRKRQWGRALREDIRRKHERGELARYEQRARQSPDATAEAHRAKLEREERLRREAEERLLAASPRPVSAPMEDMWR